MDAAAPAPDADRAGQAGPEAAIAFDAVILAGGRGSRLGGVSKADLPVGGVRLLDLVLRAASGAASTVVVGRVAVPPGVLRTLEEPPGTGPAAGLLAGLDAIPTPAEWTLVLACDLPGAADAVPHLRARAAAASDGVCLAGAEGDPEWLLGLYRTAALRRAYAAYGDPRNRSVRGLLRPLALDTVRGPARAGHDVDTWADHARWNQEHADE